MIFPKKVLSLSLAVIVLAALGYILVIKKAAPGARRNEVPQAATAPGATEPGPESGEAPLR